MKENVSLAHKLDESMCVYRKVLAFQATYLDNTPNFEQTTLLFQFHCTRKLPKMAVSCVALS